MAASFTAELNKALVDQPSIEHHTISTISYCDYDPSYKAKQLFGMVLLEMSFAVAPDGSTNLLRRPQPRRKDSPDSFINSDDTDDDITGHLVPSVPLHDFFDTVCWFVVLLTALRLAAALQ